MDHCIRVCMAGNVAVGKLVRFHTVVVVAAAREEVALRKFQAVVSDRLSLMQPLSLAMEEEVVVVECYERAEVLATLWDPLPLGCSVSSKMSH